MTERSQLLSSATFACAVALTSLAFAAPLLSRSYPLAAFAIRRFFSGLCHEEAARSFAIRGSSVAICVRCTGIYVGVAAGSAFSGFPGLRKLTDITMQRILLGAAFLNMLDVIAESLKWHGNIPPLRLLVGLPLGIAAGLLFCREQAKQSSVVDRGVRDDRVSVAGISARGE